MIPELQKLINGFKNFSLMKEKFQIGAQEFSETVTDPKIQATEVVTMTAETQTQGWTKEFDEEMRHNEGEGLEDDGGFWSRLELTWEGLAQEDSSSHPRLTEYEKEQQEYKFVEDNPMAGIENPIRGRSKLFEKRCLPTSCCTTV